MIDLTTLAAAKAYTDRQRLAYDESVSLGDTLTWDGTPTDVYVDDGNYGVYAKVSDNTPTKEDLLDGRLTILQNNTESDTYLGNDTLLQDVADVLVVADYAFVVYADNALLDGIVFPKKGIYFAHGEAGYVKSLQTLAYTFTKGELKKLDKKYLPDDISVSWNNMTDKPFGDESVTIEWDGNTEGIHSFEWNGGIFAKVSELTPEPSELIGGSFSVISPSGLDTVSITEDIMADQRAEGAPILMINAGAWFLCVIYEPFEADVIAEAGIYFTKVASNIYVSFLSYGSIKKLDPKYLPEGGVGYEGVTDIGDTLTWDGTPTDTVVQFMTDPLTEYCRVSNNTPTAEKLVGATVTLEGTTLEITDDSLVKEYDDIVAFAPEATSGGALIFVAYKDGVRMAGIEIPQKGIYFIRVIEDAGISYISSLTIEGYNFTKTEVHKIDKKFLPEILPPVAEADNGKFLQVVDGAYALVALTDVSVEGA